MERPGQDEEGLMGYCVGAADFPDRIHDDQELALLLETRRESFVLTIDDDVEGQEWARGHLERIEIPYDLLPLLKLYMGYLERDKEKRDG